MNTATDHAALRLLLDGLADRGWVDSRQMTLGVVDAVFAHPALLDDPIAIRKIVPDSFTLANGTTSKVVAEAILAQKASLISLISRANPDLKPALVQIDDIETFSAAHDISAAEIVEYATPFDVPEEYIKRMLMEILGEPYHQKDWGGELDDLFTGQVQFGGRSVTASFLLKGRGLSGPMKQRNLGKNGDQIDRLLLQPAELFVVQHVHKVVVGVRRELERGVLARRYHGHAATGTVWDGADTARLAAAYGFLNRDTGDMRSLG